MSAYPEGGPVVDTTPATRRLTVAPDPPPPPKGPVKRAKIGAVERAVRRDLRQLKANGSTLGELALVLARSIDFRGQEAAMTLTAKLIAELRITLTQIREMAAARGDDDGNPDNAAPEWPDEGTVGDRTQQPAEPGPAGGGGREAAG